MIKDHSDIKRGNPLPPQGLLFSISSKCSFICIIPYRITHTTAFGTPVVEHWQEREIAQWVHPMKDRSDDPSHHERTLLPRSYMSFPDVTEYVVIATALMFVEIISRFYSARLPSRLRTLVRFFTLFHTLFNVIFISKTGFRPKEAHGLI